MIPFHIIVAMDEARGIGKNGQLPWHLSGDFQHFRRITTSTSLISKKNVVLMGRKTWDSLPERFKPLPGRINVVLSRNQNLNLPGGVYRKDSYDEAVSWIIAEDSSLGRERVESVFVIGGEEVYRAALSLETVPIVKIYATKISGRFDCDTFFPDFTARFQLKTVSSLYEECPVSYQFAEYVRSEKAR